MNKRLVVIFLFLTSLSCFQARASHIVGGECTYKYLGDTVIGAVTCNKYQVSLTIYEDCQNGNPQAIAQDDPASVSIFYNVSPYTRVDTSDIHFATSVPVPANFSNACVTNIPPTCLLKKTFVKTYYLPPNPHGYVISYQRCCRNAAVVNILDPGNSGSTYFCVIPPSGQTNSSAVYNNFPPQIICLNNPLYYDHSATDADGDSLSYEFCDALISPTDDQNSLAHPPPYDSVTFIPPFSYQEPMTGFPAIQIDPVTGIISGTPNRSGRYLVTVCCHEWRHGVLINTSRREFQFVVTDCTKVVVANIPQYSTDVNTYIVDCTDYTVHFVNTSTGGFSYHWNFGVPGTNTDTSNEFEPTFTYPDTGTYAVHLLVNPGSSCPDSITRLVKVYPKFKADFTDTGAQCPGAMITFTDLTSATIKPITYWKWYFGDGDSVLAENTAHTYTHGGTYSVILISKNIKNCIDTATKKLVIEDFKAFAGNDTIIVKGERILFDAMGGTGYSWTPGTNLSDTDIYDPLGTYPDTGHYTYSVHVTSEYGCSGNDTIEVQVVNQASFFVPTAFTPNGDGKNDIFRPISVGYRSIQYFKVFDRFGEQVYTGNTLETGWNGNYHNKMCELGTYFWEIKFTDRFGKDAFLKGDVTLIR